jgi:hypothetical protein
MACELLFQAHLVVGGERGARGPERGHGRGTGTPRPQADPAQDPAPRPQADPARPAEEGERGERPDLLGKSDPPGVPPWGREVGVE